jgi:transcriptional regulator with XRE-family HTH domain
VEDASHSIGERIAVARKSRSLTQQQLAARVPVSLSMLRKVEQGSRDATPAFTAAVAKVLDVSVNTLTGQPYDQHGRHRDRLHAQIPGLRRALSYWDLPPHLETPPRAWDELLAATEVAARQRREAQHLALLESLPALLMETTASAQKCTGSEQERLFGLLSVQLFAAHSVTNKTGYEDLSAVVEDRISWAAERSSDPLMMALAAWSRTTSMLTVGAYDIGQELLTRVQDGLRLEGGTQEGRALGVVGPLHLRAAMLAARAGDADTARDHLAEAGRISDHLGGNDADGGYYQLSFGPSNVAIHEVAASVELGDGAAAVSRASGVRWNDPGQVPKIRAGQHFVDLSRAQLWVGDRDGALESLHAARKLAPQQTRHHPTTREVVRMLLRVHQRSNEPLARFAGWIGGDM